MRLHGLASIVAPMALGCMPHAAAAQSRVTVYVLEYVSPDGVDRQANVSQAIQDRLRLLSAQISSGVRTARYLNEMRVVRQPRVAANSVAAMRTRWRQTQDALLYMWGSIDPQAGGNLLATSNIYLGDLAAPPLDNLELAKFQLRASRHRDFVDSHSFVAAYALLQDARRIHAPKSTIAAILAQLLSIHTQLSRSPYRLPELPQLKRAIDDVARAEGIAR